MLATFFVMLVIFSCIKSVTRISELVINISKLSLTHFVSIIRHQHRCNPKFIYVFSDAYECSYSFTPAVNRNRLHPNPLHLNLRKTIQERRVRWKIIRNTTINHVMMGHVFRQRVVHRSKSLFYQSSFCRSAYMQLLLKQEWTRFRVGHIHGSRNDTFKSWMTWLAWIPGL